MGKIRFYLSIIFFVLVFNQIAVAASVEICGNGIDDPLQTGGAANGTKGSCPAGFMDSVIGNGCDRKCNSLDEDGDGYTVDGTLGDAGTTYIDCNDNDRRDFPGYYIPNSWTSPTGYKKCQANGTYTTAILNSTAPLCEATAPGVCKYIACGSGSNSNSGTYASPYLTLGKIAGGSTGSPPASAYTLNPGDVAYVMGSSDCSTTYATSLGNAHAEFNSDGTLANPITIKRYPGSTVKILADNAFGFKTYGDYYHYDDLEFTGSCTASNTTNSTPIYFNLTSNGEVSRSYFHDWTGSSYQNDSMVYANATNATNVHHNFFTNWAQGSGSCNNPGSGQNVNAIKFLDNAGSGTGSNMSANFNTAWRSTPATGFATEGGFLFYKHGIDAADAGTNGTQVKYNSVINSTVFLQWASSKMRASDNVLSGIEQIFYGPADVGKMQDNLYEYNTSYASSNFDWVIPPYTSTSQSVTVQRSIFYDTTNPYNSGDCNGIYRIHPYGTDANKSYFETNVSFSSDYNCFYNPSVALKFCYFGQDQVAPGDEAGGIYTFAQWLSNTVHDDHSFSEDPTLDSWLVPQSANCSTFGKRYVGTGGGGGGGGGGSGNGFIAYMQ